jgi:hypothetical protein
MRKAIRILLLLIAIVVLAAIVYWRLPGRVIEHDELDYVRAYDDPATSSIVINTAFDAGSFAVIDSYTHTWQGTILTIELRSKSLLSRDRRTPRCVSHSLPGRHDNTHKSSPARRDRQSHHRDRAHARRLRAADAGA